MSISRLGGTGSHNYDNKYEFSRKIKASQCQDKAD